MATEFTGLANHLPAADPTQLNRANAQMLKSALQLGAAEGLIKNEP